MKRSIGHFSFRRNFCDKNEEPNRPVLKKNLIFFFFFSPPRNNFLWIGRGRYLKQWLFYWVTQYRLPRSRDLSHTTALILRTLTRFVFCLTYLVEQPSIMKYKRLPFINTSAERTKNKPANIGILFMGCNRLNLRPEEQRSYFYHLKNRYEIDWPSLRVGSEY